MSKRVAKSEVDGAPVAKRPKGPPGVPNVSLGCGGRYGEGLFRWDPVNRRAIVAKWQEWFDQHSSKSVAWNKIVNYEWSILTPEARAEWASREQVWLKKPESKLSPPVDLGSLVTVRGTLEQRRAALRDAFNKVFDEHPDWDIGGIMLEFPRVYGEVAATF